MTMAPPPVSWLDRTIGYFSPRSGLQRERARFALMQLRHYEGAAQSRRTQGWNKAAGDANSVIGADLVTLRNVARDLVRNNAHARSALRTIRDNVVGWGIVGKPVKSNAKAEALWNAWAETRACDTDGLNDFYGLQKLIMRTVVESGEVLVRRRFRRPEDGLPIPMQLQVLDPDYIDTDKNGIVTNAAGATIATTINGIEFDALGHRAGYWLFRDHPGSTGFNLYNARGASGRISAENILHVFDQERPGQVRGVSWFAAVLLRFKDFDEYEDATLMKQKIAACLAVLTSDVDGSGAPLGTSDGGGPPMIDSLEPGMILNVPAGRSVEVVQPPSVREYADYSQTSLRAIATGLGVTYEDLTGDYCMAPETRVLRGDLRWVRADELLEGDSLVAFDEERPRGRGQRRKWRQASVVRAGQRELPRVHVVTDKATVTVSSEHKFLCVGKQGIRWTPKVGYGHVWVRADELKPGDRIAFLAKTWEEGQTHTHGYLKGMADGEGWVDRDTAHIGIAQNPGPVYTEIGEALRSIGFTPRARNANGAGKCQQWEIVGTAECLRFLGEVRPTRLLKRAAEIYDGKAMSGGKGKQGMQTHALVESAEAEGVGPVVTLSTTTQTVITEGLCSHNTGMPFSAARMSRLRHWAMVEDWRWRMLIPQFCAPVWTWAMEVAGIFGLSVQPASKWTAPPMPMIEPDKEGLAYQRLIRTGITTLSEVIRERGYDPETVWKEMAADNKRLDALGLVLDSDARNTTQAGNPRQVMTGGSTGNPAPEDEPDPNEEADAEDPPADEAED